MISAWTKHIKDPVEQERFKNSILGSKVVLDRLQELINQVEDDVDTLELTTKVYDLPNWDYRQADLNGFRRALKTISKIINLDQKDINK